MKFNITDIINFESIQIYQYFGTITFGFSVILELFYAFIIYLTTDKKLLFFRVLSFLYIGCCVSIEIILLCWKPIKLQHFPVIYPVGILSPMSSTASAGFLVGFGLLLLCLTDVLIIGIVERNFRILSFGNSKIKRIRIFTYIGLAITYLTGPIVIPSWGFGNLDDLGVRSMLETSVANIDLLFRGNFYVIKKYLNLFLQKSACLTTPYNL